MNRSVWIALVVALAAIPRERAAFSLRHHAIDDAHRIALTVAKVSNTTGQDGERAGRECRAQAQSLGLDA